MTNFAHTLGIGMVIFCSIVAAINLMNGYMTDWNVKDESLEQGKVMWFAGIVSVTITLFLV